MELVTFLLSMYHRSVLTSHSHYQTWALIHVPSFGWLFYSNWNTKYSTGFMYLQDGYVILQFLTNKKKILWSQLKPELFVCDLPSLQNCNFHIIFIDNANVGLGDKIVQETFSPWSLAHMLKCFLEYLHRDNVLVERLEFSGSTKDRIILLWKEKSIS